jgi:hypothetical protein
MATIPKNCEDWKGADSIMQAAKAGNAGFVNSRGAGYDIIPAKSVPSPDAP